ncbi:MAG: hypothetical protein IPM25_08715 [Chloracidobacterium sp.]|nr:hypothetical protein [Chloracidobacterium sp.]
MEDFFRTFSRLVRELDEPGRAAEILVLGAWGKCLSGRLVQNVVPVGMEGRKLIAGVRDELWRRNVADLGPEIARRLNASLGAEIVEFVEFRVVPAEVFETKPDLPVTAIGEKEWTAAAKNLITDEMRDAAGAIENEELRHLFLAAAGSSLARRAFGEAPVVKGTE